MERKTIIRGLRQLLLTIYDEQASGWSPDTLKPNAQARELYERQMWTQVNRKELEKWFPEFEQIDDPKKEQSKVSKRTKKKRTKTAPSKIEIDFSNEHRFLYLPPLEKNAEFVPILSLKCIINEIQTSIRLKVMLIRLGETGQKPFGIGFRLENPECEHSIDNSQNQGRHDFYHAQLLNKFDYGPQIDFIDWIPVSQPSFPLLADNPITLLFSLLLTLYGEKYCFEFYNRHSKVLPDLNKYLKGLKEQQNCEPTNSHS